MVNYQFSSDAAVDGSGAVTDSISAVGNYNNALRGGVVADILKYFTEDAINSRGRVGGAGIERHQKGL